MTEPSLWGLCSTGHNQNHGGGYFQVCVWKWKWWIWIYKWRFLKFHGMPRNTTQRMELFERQLRGCRWWIWICLRDTFHSPQHRVKRSEGIPLCDLLLTFPPECLHLVSFIPRSLSSGPCEAPDGAGEARWGGSGVPSGLELPHFDPPRQIWSLTFLHCPATSTTPWIQAVLISLIFISSLQKQKKKGPKKNPVWASKFNRISWPES